MWAADGWSDEAWVDEVTAWMVARDPDLDPHDVRDIANSLSKYPNWRKLSPQEAAAKTLAPPDAPDSP